MTLDEFKAKLEVEFRKLLDTVPEHEEGACYACGFEDGADAALGIVISVMEEAEADAND